MRLDKITNSHAHLLFFPEGLADEHWRSALAEKSEQVPITHRVV